jgi:hypothetical protein
MKSRDKKGRFIRTGKIVLCAKCGKKVYKRGCLIKKYKTFFCSSKCQQTYKPNIERLKKLRIGLPSWNKGKHPDEFQNEKHPGWKGDKVGYHGIHKWIGRHLGKPNKCDICGTEKSKKFEWASKNHEYKRIKSNWLRLCTKCHRNYDYNKIAR